MKIRSDFVTNSSSSSFTCELCGNTQSGWDIGLSEAGMVICVNGHTICEDEMLPLSKSLLIELILEMEAEDMPTPEEIEAMSDECIAETYFGIDDARYMVPEECCSICQFIEYSEYDLSKYLEKKYGVSRDEVFQQVKQLNKRRKKLYENEYITEVCQRFSINPTEIVAGWKEQFGTYAKFKTFLREG